MPEYGQMPLGLHRNQVTFGRSWKEHKSWGTTLNPDGTMNFKIYTYQDTKKVYVEVLKNPKESDQTDKVWERGFIVDREGSLNYDTLKEVTQISPIDDRSEIFELERKKG